MAPAEHNLKHRNGHDKTDVPFSAKGKLPADIGTDYTFKREIVWKNAIGFLVLHLIGLYGFTRVIYCKPGTLIWTLFVGICAATGITMGAHRLWSHKAFKATYFLRFMLVTLQTIAGQNCMYIWVRDHRQHHKYSDTDADPHNAKRGFFFSHIGWLMSKKHPAIIEKGKTIDMSDLEQDPIVMFQKKYYKPLYVLLAFILPVSVPYYFFGETLYNSVLVAYVARYILSLNITWSVNSVAHVYGTKPFDKYILPVESALVAMATFGEGWHNYHHTFPWDYRAAEFGSKYSMTTTLIDLMAYFGQAYDLRAAPYQLIEDRVRRTGDGTHQVFGSEQVSWSDRKNISEDEAALHCEEEKRYVNEKVLSNKKRSSTDRSVQG